MSEDFDMARVKVNKETLIVASPVVNVVYQAGSIVVAPRAHIEQIVAMGHGERVEEAMPASVAPAPAASIK